MKKHCVFNFDDISIETFNEDAPDINARSAIVIDLMQDAFCMKKCLSERPHSTTKIMTAIVAIENGI